VIGHCSGGRQAFLAACSLPLDAAVDCYGAFVTVEPPESLGLRATPLLPIADRLSCPLLGLFGEEDRYPSPEQTAELEAVLTKHGKTFEFHVRGRRARVLRGGPGQLPAAGCGRGMEVHIHLVRSLPGGLRCVPT
jgi:dienelactone hydrolase